MKKKLLHSIIYSVLLAFFWMLLFLLFFKVFGTRKGAEAAFMYVFAAGHAAEFGLSAALLLAVFSLLPRRAQGICAITIGVLISSFLLVDYIVYRQFRVHITGAMLSMFFGPASGDIFAFPPIMYVQTVLGLFAVTAACWLMWFISSFLAAPKLRIAPIALGGLMLLCAAGYNLVHSWASFVEYNPVTRQMTVLPVVYPFSANKMLAKMGYKVPERLERFEPALMKYPLVAMDCRPESTPDILVIMLDGYRFDMATEEVSPNIFDISGDAQVFTQHNANANHTRHGVFSFFYGLPGAYWDAAVTDTIGPVFIDTLKQLNYDFGIFASAALTSPEFHKTVFSAVPGLRLSTEGGSAPARDLKITDEFVEFLDTRDKSQPFFSFLFYDSPHAYDYDKTIFPPKFLPAGVKNYFQLPDQGDIVPLLNQYKNSVAYSDMLVGRVLEALKSRGLDNDTIVIITGDHGEEFNDLGKDYWGHNGNYSRWQTQVPMIIRWPGKEPRTYDYRTSHLDVVPTLMEDVFGCTASTADYSTGVNLFEPDGRGFIYMQGDEYAIMTGDIITIFRKLGPVETVTLNYDPTNERVPGEVLRNMLEELARFKK